VQVFSANILFPKPRNPTPKPETSRQKRQASQTAMAPTINTKCVRLNDAPMDTAASAKGEYTDEASTAEKPFTAKPTSSKSSSKPKVASSNTRSGPMTHALPPSRSEPSSSRPQPPAGLVGKELDQWIIKNVAMAGDEIPFARSIKRLPVPKAPKVKQVGGGRAAPAQVASGSSSSKKPAIIDVDELAGDISLQRDLNAQLSNEEIVMLSDNLKAKPKGNVKTRAKEHSPSVELTSISSSDKTGDGLTISSAFRPNICKATTHPKRAALPSFKGFTDDGDSNNNAATSLLLCPFPLLLLTLVLVLRFLLPLLPPLLPCQIMALMGTSIWMCGRAIIH
jgi:hypothetical protein